MERKLAEGWSWGVGPKDVVEKLHPCLVPYADLPEKQRTKDFIFHGIVRGMLKAKDV